MEERLFDAVIFDLDGVITQTALVHSRAWKRMFDGYLREREEMYGETFREFSHQEDYLPYVDGKPRYDGVRSFLESRNIQLPFGTPEDGPEQETICGIGNRKNIVFNDTLAAEGVKVYPSTVELIHKLKSLGIHVGVASSSKNCRQVLDAAGLSDLIETRIDGVVSAELGLNGKPEPDIFITAADRLGVAYDRAVVVEDAVSGVMAGKKGNFGLVLGIAREENKNELLEGGADIVVEDIAEIGYDGIERWFEEGLPADGWQLVYHGFDPGREKTRESLLTIGNGYMGTRGAMEEASAGEDHYPGTYMAGLYNRRTSKVADRFIENEDFVNITNWLPVDIRIDDGPWLSEGKYELLSMKRSLHFDKGTLCRTMLIRQDDGKEAAIYSERFVSMHDRHLAGMKFTVTPLNFDGSIECRAGLSGNHINDGVARYRSLDQKHLEPVESISENDLQCVVVATTGAGIKIATAARINFSLNDNELNAGLKNSTGPGLAETSIIAHVKKAGTLSMEKIAAVFKSDDPGAKDIVADALYKAGHAGNFNDLLSGSSIEWKAIWQRADIHLEGDRLAQKLLRLHLFHLMVSISPFNADIDAGIPARGLHGEAYRGHIFWDEIFILPLYYMHFPEAARAVLDYRYNRLGKAREYAGEHGEKGAMFPWQSGSDGREETQVLHLNPLSGEWGPDHSSLQRHVSLAIAYNIIEYLHYTNDKTYYSRAAEMLVEICRFWAGKAGLTEEGRYSISGVMGPDEFHEKYSGAESGGLRDNAYTNIMAAWMFGRTLKLLKEMEGKEKADLFGTLGLGDHELMEWADISHKLRLVVSEDGIIAQYDGYFDLEELDWDYYRSKYGNIYRMDRLLKAEGKTPDEYKVAKQADMLMSYYNLDAGTVDSIIRGLGYQLPEHYLKDNLNYYLARTSHGSTLSRVVHAKLASMVGDKQLSWRLYRDALTSDYQDIQGGTTAEGIHAGVMAGTVLIALFTYAGLNLQGDMVRINPDLPGHWRKISFNFTFKGINYRCEVNGKEVRLVPDSDVVVEINGIRHEIIHGESPDLECPSH